MIDSRCSQQVPVTDTAEALNVLANEIRTCTRCRLSERRIQAVTSEAQPGARILLAGESPGATEDRLGKNFCGPSGKFLDRCLQSVGLSRKDVNVSPVLHCHPPGNRNPFPNEAEACLPYFHRHLELVRPEMVLIMGGVAARWLLGEPSVSAVVGTWREWNGLPTLITFHPAAGLRFPAKREAILRHLAMVAERLSRH